MELHICHLYADLMNTYGDDGNIICLRNRCLWRNIKVTIDQVTIGGSIDPDKYDLYFFGGGQDQQQARVSKDLKLHNGQKLKAAAQKGAVILAICGGYQLLGNYYQPKLGPKLDGVGLLNMETIASDKRMIGNVVVKLNPQLLQKIAQIYTWRPPEHLEHLVGFENHSGQTILNEGVNSLGKVIIGRGNNGNDGTEGAYWENIYGCYLHGSFLPKNPHFADWLIYLALKRRYPQIFLDVLDDNLEWQAHFAALKRARQTR